MSEKIRVKICGLTQADAVTRAVAAGAAYVGFAFFEKSPRHLSLAAARALSITVPPGVCKVALTVDASDEELGAILDRVPIDMLQLHGNESPERVSQVKQTFGLPVMKAVGVARAGDVRLLDAYARVADQILVDAKPAKDAALPGGNGVAFDWRLIAGRRWPVPWMLAGGLNRENVAEAIRLTGASQVDVSSGVESAPGIKDGHLIDGFLKAVSQE